MGMDLPQNATLPPETLRSAMRGLMALREIELNETHRFILGAKDSHPCSASNCPLHIPTLGSDRTVGSSQFGMDVLQVPELCEDRASDLQHASRGVCSGCAKKWQSVRAELRKKAWEMLPYVFGLKG